MEFTHFSEISILNEMSQEFKYNDSNKNLYDLPIKYNFLDLQLAQSGVGGGDVHIDLLWPKVVLKSVYHVSTENDKFNLVVDSYEIDEEFDVSYLGYMPGSYDWGYTASIFSIDQSGKSSYSSATIHKKGTYEVSITTNMVWYINIICIPHMLYSY